MVLENEEILQERRKDRMILTGACSTFHSSGRPQSRIEDGGGWARC